MQNKILIAFLMCVLLVQACDESGLNPELMFLGLDTFSESESNDGSVENNLILHIEGAEFKDTLSELSLGQHYVFDALMPLPQGMALQILRLDDMNLDLRILGQASAHEPVNSKSMVKVHVFKNALQGEDALESIVTFEFAIEFNA